MWKRWRIRILLFLAVLGPGFITANVDNDSGGILTYSQAGAQYGYTLLWTIIPITIALIVVQEMCARMGVVTGKGLSDLIREEFGLRLTFMLMVLLVVVNYTNVVTEFIGIAGSHASFSRYQVHLRALLRGAGLVHGGDAEATRARKKSSSSPRWFISPTSLPACSRSPVGTMRCWPPSSCPPNRCGATRPICTWPSAWSAPPSPRGCSSICNRRSWRRAFASRTTRPRGWT